MFKFDILAEEKETKAGIHKNISITFEKKSSNLFLFIIKLIMSLF